MAIILIVAQATLGDTDEFHTKHTSDVDATAAEPRARSTTPSASPLAPIFRQLTEIGTAATEVDRDKFAKLVSLWKAIRLVESRLGEDEDTRRCADQIAELLLAPFECDLNQDLPEDPVERARILVDCFRNAEASLPDGLEEHPRWTRIRVYVRNRVEQAADRLSADVQDAGLTRVSQAALDAVVHCSPSLAGDLDWLADAALAMDSPELVTAPLLTARAWLAMFREDTGSARSLLDRALATEPDHLAALELRGYLAAAEREWNCAASTLRRAFNMAPDDASEMVGVNAANSLRMIDDFEEAIQICDRLIESHPACWRAFVNRAWARISLRGPEAGRADFETALGLCTDAQWKRRIRRELAGLDAAD